MGEVFLPTPAEMSVALHNDLLSFTERSFYELNPGYEFLHNWHIEVMTYELMKCARGETTRLILNLPPRYLKSHAVSVSFPAWQLGIEPSTKIIVVSYGQELANKLAFECRAVMNSNWYRRYFSTRLTSTQAAASDFKTTRSGFRYGTSFGGAVTGRGADFLIIDDPHKPEEALSDVQRNSVNECFAHTLLTRLNDKRLGCIIVVMQRLHEDDLTGYLLRQGGWRHIRFPAIAESEEVYTVPRPRGQVTFRRHAGEALHPERESIETLRDLEKALGPWGFASQYQLAPMPVGGGIIKQDWIKFQSRTEFPAHWDYLFQSWDTANKPTELSDFSVCTTWAVKNKHLFLLSVFRARLDYPSLKRAVREQRDQWRPRAIVVEDKASGTQLIQELIWDGVYAVKRYKPELDKIMRLHTVSAMFENGFIHVPREAEWVDSYVHELVTFPYSKFDDQVDSTSQALDWFKQGGWAPTCRIGQFVV